jgi:hypothetical protein
VPDLPETVVQLIPPPWNAARLGSELLRSEPDEVIEVRTEDGTAEYRVTGVRRWRTAGRGWGTVLSVREYDPAEDLVRLVAVEAE